MTDRKKQKISNILADVPPFQGAVEDVLKLLEAQAVVRECEKGRILFLQDDPADYFYVIVSGLVKLFRETVDGTQAVIDVLSAGRIFGECGAFLQKKYTYGTEIVENAELIAIPLSALSKAIEMDGKFSMNMLDFMARRQGKSAREIESLSLQSAPQRIGCFLLQLVPQGEAKNVAVHLPYDKTLIASRLGMQPETFSRALRRLTDVTGVRVKGAIVEIDDVQRIMDYSCAACSSGFPCENLDGCS